jgi:hypothetical protein
MLRLGWVNVTQDSDQWRVFVGENKHCQAEQVCPVFHSPIYFIMAVY